MHGHQSIDDVFNKILPDVTWIILAHEHPAIVLHDNAGGKHKFRCFLKGRWKKYNVLVLPAYSPFTSGAIVNEVEKDEILSPILREIGLKDFKPLVVDSGELLTFPTLEQIREVNGLYLKELK
jgi:metallophosphoesterase superfamily enzyme